MKKITLISLFSCLLATSFGATWFSGNDNRPVILGRGDSWQADVQLSGTETAYTGAIDLLKVPFVMATAGDSVLYTKTALYYVPSCFDVADSTGGTDSALVSFIPQFTDVAIGNTQPASPKSEAWSATADSVAMALPSETLAKGTIKTLYLPNVTSRWLRFKIVGRSATVKNAGQRCQVTVLSRQLIK